MDTTIIAVGDPLRAVFAGKCGDINTTIAVMKTEVHRTGGQVYFPSARVMWGMMSSFGWLLSWRLGHGGRSVMMGDGGWGMEGGGGDNQVCRER